MAVRRTRRRTKGKERERGDGEVGGGETRELTREGLVGVKGRGGGLVRELTSLCIATEVMSECVHVCLPLHVSVRGGR